MPHLSSGDCRIDETGVAVADLGNRIVSANAYIGAQPIAEALANGADIVITGRAADPSLFVGPLSHEFGWAMDDWRRLGQATLIGHLLECAGQVTGGYFADPGYKDVPGLARLGFPIGEVSEDGSVVITKVAGSGGQVTPATCKEQILYEIHDPTRYFTPDVIADFATVTVEEIGPDRVRVQGASGSPRPETLKVSLEPSRDSSARGRSHMPGLAPAWRLALDIVRRRLRLTGVRTSELRFDLIGVNALHGNRLSGNDSRHEPYEVRVRVVGRTDSLDEAARIGNEVETLYTNGPAGGGGVTKSAREVVGILSTYIRAILSAPPFTTWSAEMKLRQIAHSRTGDKGNTSSISVIAYNERDYPILLRQVTSERVKAHFGDLVAGDVIRYEIPSLGALNFVLRQALGGGVTRSLILDTHGKSLSSALLDLEIPNETDTHEAPSQGGTH